MSVALKKKGHTCVYEDEKGYTIVVLYNTQIAKFNSSEIILNSGGYLTDTTKNRMNQCFFENNIPISIYQRKGQWYINSPKGIIEFSNHMILDRFELNLLITIVVYKPSFPNYYYLLIVEFIGQSKNKFFQAV